jgi:hypothetical protein
MNDAEWFVHVNLKKASDGTTAVFKRSVDTYMIPMTRAELSGYRDLRVGGRAAPPMASGIAQ